MEYLVDENNNNMTHMNNANNLPATTTTSSGISSTTNTTNTGQAPKPRGRRKKIRAEPIRPICPQCEKQFSNQSALTKHKLTHSDERKFACQQCSKAFKRHDHLTGHMQTHSNRKPFNCTIQGCDKTYCDARSLRRHKENIHHIVTPKESNGSGSNSNSSSNHSNSNSNNNMNFQQQQQQQQQHHQHQDIDKTTVEQVSCVTSSTVTINQQQPSHLLRRRIQRLHSDPGGQFNEPTRLLEPSRYLDSNHDQHHQHQYHMGSQTPQHSHHHHHHHHQPHNQHLQHQQASVSADYASSTRHFFDSNQMTPVEQQYCNGGTMPHSANSINDSSLGLSVHYEQQQPMTPITPNHPNPHHNQQQHTNNTGYVTPTTTTIQMHPPTPTMLAPQQSAPPTPYAVAPINKTEHQNYQQQTDKDSFNNNTCDVIHHQPSQLLRKRAQRLRSDPGGPHDPLPLPDFTCRPIETNRRSVDIINHQCHHQQAPYSAPYYASTQHFSFDFNHQMLPMDQQYCSVDGSTGTIPPHSADSITDGNLESSMQQQGPISADYASTRHFFDLNQMEQQYCSSGSLPHSSDSINDSSLGLSCHYEQQQPLTPSYPNPHHNQQQQQNTNNSGYITPTAMQPPTPTMLAPQQSAPPTPYAAPIKTEHQNYQQTNELSLQPNFTNSSNVVHHQPSQLLRKRAQRLRSDPGGPDEPLPLPDLNRQPIDTNRRSVDTINQHCHQQQASHSADYASTQHFSFDFNHQIPPAPIDQKYSSGAGSTGTLPPHSADSLTDSSIELSFQYEQQDCHVNKIPLIYK